MSRCASAVRASVTALQRGFTLVEMLVVLTLMSLLVLAMASALSTVGQTQDRVDYRMNVNDDYRVANQFLRGALGHIWVRRTNANATLSTGMTQTPGALPFSFQAGPTSMTWVGIMPARFGAGGRYYFNLAVVPTRGGSNGLMLSYLPWDPGSALPSNWGNAESRVLVPNIRQFNIQYEDAMTEPPTWGGEWVIGDRLPTRVMLNIATDIATWPTVVVAMRAFPTVAGVGASIGGGSDN